MKPKKKPKTHKVYNYITFEDLACNIEGLNELDYQEYENYLDLKELEDEIKLNGSMKGRKV